MRVERLTSRGWHAVAGVPVGPSGAFRVPLRRSGSYRVSSAEAAVYLGFGEPPGQRPPLKSGERGRCAGSGR